MKRANILVLLLCVLVFVACEETPTASVAPTSTPEPTNEPSLEPTLAPPPHEGRYGIYSLDLNTQQVELIYSSNSEITKLIYSPAADRFAFAQKVGGNDLEHDEIFTLGVDGQNLRQLTDNSFLDTYPAWSPGGTRIAYLSMRTTLDIFIMYSDGGQQELLYDSGFHDADVDWVGDMMAFTQNSQIWIMNADGTDARQLTDPDNAGEWGNANLPFGDYDPRISPDGSMVTFERLVDDSSPHGIYDIFLINIDGTNLVNITNSEVAQGLVNWTSDGSEIGYIVTVIDDVGQFDLYMMNTDGTNSRNIMPESFPPDFLVHWFTFGEDDETIYFIGEWWPVE